MEWLRKIRILFTGMILILVLCMLFIPPAEAEAGFTPFFRFDLDSPAAWQEPLENVRFLTGEAYCLQPISADKLDKYGLDPDALPDIKGLDTLNISGSAEFSENQFRQLASKLRRLADGKEIYIFDCRIEEHALVNGISVSWYGDHNWANHGMTLAEAEADEYARFSALPGTVIPVYTVSDNAPDKSAEIAVSSWMTEKELVESEGFHYVRLACPDHSWPYEEAINQFIGFVRTLDKDRVWLHFHCQAGKSRTGIFMAIYDMMKNPEVSFEDIMLRHAMTGSSYFPYADPDSEIADVYALRARRIRQVYDYLHEKDVSRMIPWSEWIAEKETATSCLLHSVPASDRHRIFRSEYPSRIQVYSSGRLKRAYSTACVPGNPSAFRMLFPLRIRSGRQKLHTGPLPVCCH